MRKHLLLLFVPFIFISAASEGQVLKAASNAIILKTIFKGVVNRDGSTCDTSNTDATGLTIYTFNGNHGFVSGTNTYYSKIAASYNLSASSDTYINGMLFYFAYANSNNTANLNRTISLDVYSNAGGAPGTLLYSTTRTIADLKTDVDNNNLTSISISPGVLLPTNKKFFITLDFSNLSWSTASGGDSIAVVTDSVYTQGQGYGYYNGAWVTYTNLIGANLGLYIFPITSGSPSCSSLPLQLLSFGVQKQNENALLNWTVINEENMKQYEVQRAVGNFSFTTIQTVNAINSLSSHSYNVSDVNALTALKGNIYYRLKQVNMDGSFTYSRIVSINTNDNGIKVNFSPNPFTSSLAMQINLQNAANANVRVYDMQGRFTGFQKQILLNTGSQSVEIPGMANLKAGTYLIDIMLGTEHLHYTVVKQ